MAPSDATKNTTAHHEAAHAVALVHGGVSLLHSWLFVSVETGDWEGMTGAQEKRPEHIGLTDWRDALVIGSLAGLATEALRLSQPNPPLGKDTHDDWNQALDLCIKSGMTKNQGLNHRQRKWREAMSLVDGGLKDWIDRVTAHIVSKGCASDEEVRGLKP